MIGNQFIKWYETIPEDCEQAMPIPFDDKLTLFFDFNDYFRYTIVDIDGNEIGAPKTWILTPKHATLSLGSYESYLQGGKCFRIMVIYYVSGKEKRLYSNALVRTKASYNVIPYWSAQIGSKSGSGQFSVSGLIEKDAFIGDAAYFHLHCFSSMNVEYVMIDGENFEFEVLSGAGSSDVYIKVIAEDLSIWMGDPFSIGVSLSTGGEVTIYQYTPEKRTWLGDDTEGLSLLQYYCNEDAFGIPFKSAGGYTQLWIPINLKNPQNKQDDKVYVKANGEVVVLYAKYYKEWEAESEYITGEMHDSLVAALSCDHVYINGVRMTKSDSYEIDWENSIKKACGQKLAKATWKMRANVMERNSNC